MKLQFTNGYRPRFDQISRILQFLLAQGTRGRVPQQELVDMLGVPKRQTESLISMMTGFGLVRPIVTTLTPLGKAITEGDPYFGKLETLWMIHYVVSSNPELVVWNRIVNQVIPALDRYTIEGTCCVYFQDLTVQVTERTFTEKLPKEVGAVYSSYARSELHRLNLVEEVATGEFARANPVDIPSQAFLFCLVQYRDLHSPGSSALNVEEISLAESSPGQVLNLPEYQVRQLLDELHRNGFVRLEMFANLDQVRLPDSLSQQTVLEAIYRS